MVVDIGAGQLRLRFCLWATSSMRILCVLAVTLLDESIIAYLRRTHNLLIGEATAERIKKTIGIARRPDKGSNGKAEVRGRDLVNGVPKEINMTEI